MTTQVVNLSVNKYDVYIGRPSIYGNRYSSKPSRYPDTIIVATKQEAIRKYTEWLLTLPNLTDLLINLKDKKLGCFCKTGLPNRLECHGQVLAYLADHWNGQQLDEILEGSRQY